MMLFVWKTSLRICLLCLLWAMPTQSKAAPIPQMSPQPFLTGADLSWLPYQDGRGVKYFDGGGASDLLVIAKRSRWRIIRVRLWVDPAADPRSTASGLPQVTALAKRIKAAHLEFLLDIHYSETWADPGHQKKTAAWEALPFPRLVQQVQDYSRAVVTHLRLSGALPDIVQIGNETRNGLLYGSGPNESGPERATRLLSAGLRGVREGAYPAASPRTMIHVPDSQDTKFVQRYFQALQTHAATVNPTIPLDFDLIGLSYYPGDPWDRKTGLEPWKWTHLIERMQYVAAVLHKPVMVVETSWPQTGEPAVMPGTPEFPLTPQGQVQFYRALLRAVHAVPKGLGVGVVLWEPDMLGSELRL